MSRVRRSRPSGEQIRSALDDLKSPTTFSEGGKKKKEAKPGPVTKGEKMAYPSLPGPAEPPPPSTIGELCRSFAECVRSPQRWCATCLSPPPAQEAATPGKHHRGTLNDALLSRPRSTSGTT